MPTVAAVSTRTTLQYHMGQRRQQQSVVVVAAVRPRLLWILKLLLVVVVAAEVVAVGRWATTSFHVVVVVDASTTTYNSVTVAPSPSSIVRRKGRRPTKSWYNRVQQPSCSSTELLPLPCLQREQQVVPTTVPLAVSPPLPESKVSSWTARQRWWRRRQIFTCWLTASAGFANVQASHLYGSWLNVCSGNVLRVGAVLANALVVVVVVRGGGHHHRANGNNDSGGAAAAASSISWTVPVAVLVGYTGGTALVRWTHNRMALQQQQQEQAAKAAAAALESSLASSSSSSSSSSSLRANPNSHNWEEDPPGTAPPRRAEPTAATTFTALPPPSLPVVALRVVRTMGPWIGACLVGADVLAAVQRATTKTMLVPCALLQAMAYGMIHLAASDASGGLVLFAITGHLAGATKATIDHCQQQQQHSGSGLGTSDSSATRTTTPTGWYHACMVVSFLVGSIVGSLVWDHAVPACLAATTTTTPRWMPIHSWTGLFYATLFWWYAQPLQE
jgi:hypothetical protein